MPSGNLNVLPIPDEVITNINNLLQQIEAALQPYIPPIGWCLTNRNIINRMEGIFPLRFIVFKN